MEQLTQLSKSVFQSTQRFVSPLAGRHFETFEVAVVNRDGHFQQIRVAEADLGHWAATTVAPPLGDTTTSDNKVVASFKMVCLEENVNHSLSISRDGFYTLFNAMRADPAALYMTCQAYDGFHEFPSSSRYNHTWFFGTSIHSIMWTFDDTVTPARTVAMYIARRRNAMSGFGEVIRTFSCYANVAQMLLLVIPVHMANWFDTDARNELDIVQQIEGSTGFGPRHRHPATKPENRPRLGDDSYFNASNFAIDELTKFSQGVNEVAGKISNNLRHQRVLLTMLERLASDAAQVAASPQAAASCSGASPEESLRLLNTAVPTVKSWLNTSSEYLAYLRDRSERLSQVLFALLTHQDAAATIDLGVASKRDTSSMKTIAIVTMVFLPATFIAALFEVPLLDWEGQKIMSGRFWIYWAFTIPMTTLVFVVWLGTTERQWLMHQLAWMKTKVSTHKAWKNR